MGVQPGPGRLHPTGTGFTRRFPFRLETSDSDYCCRVIPDLHFKTRFPSAHAILMSSSRLRQNDQDHDVDLVLLVVDLSSKLKREKNLFWYWFRVEEIGEYLTVWHVVVKAHFVRFTVEDWIVTEYYCVSSSFHRGVVLGRAYTGICCSAWPFLFVL